MDNLVFVAIALVAMLAAALVVLAKKQSAMRRELSDSQARIEQLMEELKALYAGAAGQGSHIARIEQQISSLSDRQEQLDVQDPTTQSYSEAIELIHAGASIEELTRRGLRREEAELLMRMHGSQSLG
jgi:Tfp pilus assembly protein PilO